MIELLSALPSGLCRILVTGRAGFIGGVVVRWLLRDKDAYVFNLDKCAYSSERSNREVVEAICELLDQLRPRAYPMPA